jgi:hypothetical protein
MAETAAKDNRPNLGAVGRTDRVPGLRAGSGNASSRCQDHDHLAPFEPGILFNLGKFGGVVAHAI